MQEILLFLAQKIYRAEEYLILFPLHPDLLSGAGLKYTSAAASHAYTRIYPWLIPFPSKILLIHIMKNYKQSYTAKQGTF